MKQYFRGVGSVRFIWPLLTPTACVMPDTKPENPHMVMLATFSASFCLGQYLPYAVVYLVSLRLGRLICIWMGSTESAGLRLNPLKFHKMYLLKTLPPIVGDVNYSFAAAACFRFFFYLHLIIFTAITAVLSSSTHVFLLCLNVNTNVTILFK